MIDVNRSKLVFLAEQAIIENIDWRKCRLA